MSERKSKLTQDICIPSIGYNVHRPNVFDVGQTLHKVIQMFFVHRVSIQVYDSQFRDPRRNTVSLFANQGPAKSQS